MSPPRLRQPSILAVFLIWTAVGLFSLGQSALIRAREDQAAIRSVAALGDVLRGALRQTEPEVALRPPFEGIAAAVSYSSIMRPTPPARARRRTSAAAAASSAATPTDL